MSTEWFNNLNFGIQQKLSSYVSLEDIQVIINEATAALRSQLAAAEAERDALHVGFRTCLADHALKSDLTAAAARAHAAEARVRELEAQAATMRENVTSALHLEWAAVLDPSVRDASATLDRAQKAEAAIASLTRERDEAVAILRENEFGGDPGPWQEDGRCLDCGNERHQGHVSGCKVKGLLGPELHQTNVIPVATQDA